MKYIKTLLFSLLLAVSVSVFAEDGKQNSVSDADKQTIEITINGDKYFVSDVSSDTRAEIFSIIGLKVKTVEIKSGYGSEPISLPKGYYIIKVENTTRKIAVK